MMAGEGILVDDFLAYTIGIIVYFIGRGLNERVAILRRYHIPDPVTGGLLAALAIALVHVATGLEIAYEMETRDILLVYFFTGIGLNARVADLVRGGKPLALLLGLTLGYIVLQDVVGVAAALALGEPLALGILAGSASLIGGHGTTIAWAPEIAASHGVANALEFGVAAATLGLVVASLLGGPIARLLLPRQKPDPQTGIRVEETPVVGIAHDHADTETINHISIMRVVLTLHIAMVLGYLLNQALNQAEIKLPLFVSCLMVAILLSNTVPRLLPRLHWPARTRALALVSDFSLGLFIAMSLMGMQLWTLGDLAGSLAVILALQVVCTIGFILLILFPLMGRTYLATVLSAGFAGFALGATPTAVANMTAVTKSHGPAPTAFIILPLVGAFFVDITNAFVIQAFLRL